MTLVIDEEAKQELREAARFYEDCRAGLGQKFLNAIEGAYVEIQERPEFWRRFRGRFRRCLLRRFPYAVIYAIEPDCIYVAAIMHAKRSPDYWIHRRRGTP